ncbi:TonB-dependent receptor [Trinickia caryophylli]|uniref:Iron complex outermembrane recepter protein n=1 Tax=Trinickia caryophylli TaxID=28094 RepID=A0A1X7DUA3_TRICW|nr:TonB-dependent receptor [Trinickia caryophylli]PMS08782.1 TonB-dependent receptor [Trinickia caryophylli]TRX18031.1 TonB-dependent receptor [Trinickia caryophylli]WQE11188.1 TonB-dependent receptor [Trinickia caryophylli]SMF21420.1 iron complex outermembrane recepter protein [Trinickia caryophylli]GLU32332.1 ferric siderophore receptor [Trinickia caryophylli]
MKTAVIRHAPSFRRKPGPARLIASLLFAAGHAGLVCAQTTTNADETSAAAKGVLPAVKVTAGAVTDPGQHLRTEVTSGALGARSQLDTPFSTTVVTNEQLADQQTYKLGDVFIGDASVTDNSGAYSAWASYMTVRGMQLDWQTGYRIDGMPFIAYGITMPYEQLDRVELLKGLTGFMYGFGAPGGVVNYVTKKPTETVRSVDIGYRNNGVWSEHADLGGRFGPDDMFGARLNVTHEDGKTYNNGNVRRDTVSLSLDGHLTRDLSVSFGALYQNRHTDGQTPSIYTGSLPGGSLPSTISAGNSNLAGNDQYLNTNLQLYTAGVRYQLSPDWAFSSTFSYSQVSRERNESTLYLLDSAGNYSDARWNGKEGHQFSLWQGMFEGKVKTGPFSHDLVLGAAWQRQTNDYARNSTFATLGAGNLYSSDPYRYYSPGGLETYRDSDITQKSLFASDTMHLTSRLSVLAGLRYTNYQQNSYTTSGALSSSYDQSGVLTPTFAVMYKLDPQTTLYASYVESLEQGARVGDTYANAGQLLRPLRSRQYELGIKTERSRWSASAAVFRIERGAEYANASNVYVQDGESIFQGVEAGGALRLGRDWRVSGDLMLLDSWYAKGSAYNGNRVAGAPTFVAAGRIAYTVPYLPGLQVGVDAKFTGNTQLRAAGDLKVPGFLLVNLGASYMTRIGGHDVTLRAALDNVLNRRYWEFQYADYVKPGDPRTISLNAKIDF